MGGGPPRPGAAPFRSKALLVLPVLLCLVILWQTVQLYGSCNAIGAVTSVDTLHTYLLDSSQSMHRRNSSAADAMQQLAADIKGCGPKAAQLTQQLNETRALLEAAREQASKLQLQLQALQEQLSTKELQSQKQQQELKEKDEQLVKQQNELVAQKQLPQQPQQPQQGLIPKEDLEAGRLHVLETAGLQCNPVKDQEFWADPLIWGYDHRAKDAAQCCAACHAYTATVQRGGTEKGVNGTRCNIWAFCADKELCKERYGECWVKHETKVLPPPPTLPPGAHAVKGWISGAIYPNHTQLDQYSNSRLVFHTPLGDIDIELLPDLAPTSVRELRRMAALHSARHGFCSNCRIYRPEPNFLVQGLLEAPGSYIAVPRHPSPPQPMMMPRGMICWAGGTGGPHFFVNLIDQGGFKDEHLCWGKVADMTLFDKIVALPKRDKKPGEMNELVDHIRFNMSMKAVPAAL